LNRKLKCGCRLSTSPCWLTPPSLSYVQLVNGGRVKHANTASLLIYYSWLSHGSLKSHRLSLSSLRLMNGKGALPEMVRCLSVPVSYQYPCPVLPSSPSQSIPYGLRSRSEELLLESHPGRYSNTQSMYRRDGDLPLSAFVQTARVRHHIPAAYYDECSLCTLAMNNSSTTRF